jgi:hypothetical protein
MVLTTTFNNNSVTFVYRCGQLIRGGNLSTQKKNQTCRKLLTNSTCSTYLSPMRSKQVHNVYRFMYHYICKLRINLISQYFPPSWEV